MDHMLGLPYLLLPGATFQNLSSQKLPLLHEWDSFRIF